MPAGVAAADTQANKVLQLKCRARGSFMCGLFLIKRRKQFPSHCSCLKKERDSHERPSLLLDLSHLITVIGVNS